MAKPRGFGVNRGLLESESQSSFGNEIGSVCWL